MGDANLLFKCKCGSYHYLEVSAFEPEEDWPQEFFVALVDEPISLKEKVQCLLGREGMAREVLLSLEQATQLRDMLLEQIPLENNDG